MTGGVVGITGGVVGITAGMVGMTEASGFSMLGAGVRVAKGVFWWVRISWRRVEVEARMKPSLGRRSRVETLSMW